MSPASDRMRKVIAMDRFTPARGSKSCLRRRLSLLTALVLAGMLIVYAAPAHAAQAWRIDAFSDTTIARGGTMQYLVQMSNVGDADMDGSEIDVTGTLPPGLTAVDARLVLDADPSESNFVSCTAGDGLSPIAGASDFKCVDTTPLQAPRTFSTFSFQLLYLTVQADPSASGTLLSSFAVSGGGAASASTVDPVRVSDAVPPFGLAAADGEVLDGSGAVDTQAGGHPASATVSFDLNTFFNPLGLGGTGWPVGPVKDVVTDLPPGFIGYPAAADQCTGAELAAGNTATLCPPTSQVGTAMVHMNDRPLGPPIYGPIPVFNMVPPPNAPARFGFNIAGTVVTLDGGLSLSGQAPGSDPGGSDNNRVYRISVTASNLSEAVPIAGSQVTLWGVPSDPSHDSERACPGTNVNIPSRGGPTCPSGAPPLAFLRNPTSCTDPGVGLTTLLHVDSWLDPGNFQTASFVSHALPGYPLPSSDWGAPEGTTGCDRVPFDPALQGQPQSRTPNSPAGFSFDLTLPQSQDPTTVSESDLRTAVVTLPAGVRVNPSAADGLQACSTADIHLDDTQAPTCPDASKVGTVTITTPLLRTPLSGEIYLAAPHDNPFDNLLSIYLVAHGSGVVIKLAGRVDLDPVTGQITATFDNNPQTPFSDVNLSFDGGPRAQLVTPSQCGDFRTHAVFTGWNGRVVETDTQPFTISGDGNGAACPGPTFAPTLSAGTASNSAGSSSSLQLRFTRSDLDQEIAGLTINLPEGLTGKIADVVLCSDTDAAQGTCPDGTKIGDVTAGAGAGTNPFFITNGRAYLTGPYKGAPFGVAIVVPAVAGPFNLGNVVVRSALFVDKHDASVRVVVDPLPTILQGIPLQVRDVRVNVDKPGFFLNPTSCAVKTVSSTLTSTGGLSANVSDRFQAADCASLGFAPRMVLAVGGRGHLHAGASTPLSTRITMPRGDANLRFVRVTLPSTINARLTVINDACTRAEFETDIAKCGHAQAGTAVAVTPLLRDPLRGKVYFVKNGHPIPDLFIALRGQVAFDLIGRVTIPGGKKLATTFSTAPDVPIRSFTLRLFGDSKNGSVGAAKNLCAASSKTATAALDFIGQNGKVSQLDQRLVIHGCPKPKARKATKRR